jgi:hypothetical protein
MRLRLAAAVLPIFVSRALAQDDTALHAVLAETVAFFRLASKPCAYTLDASAHSWPSELLSLMTALKQPVTEAEIEAKSKEIEGERAKLGNAEWCHLYAVEMRQAHLFYSMSQGR